MELRWLSPNLEGNFQSKKNTISNITFFLSVKSLLNTLIFRINEIQLSQSYILLKDVLEGQNGRNYTFKVTVN